MPRSPDDVLGSQNPKTQSLEVRGKPGERRDIVVRRGVAHQIMRAKDTGVITTIGFEEAALALAGLERRYYLAGRLKWLRDWSVAIELEKYLWIHACDIAVRERWPVERGTEVLRRLAGLAIAETADPGNWRTQQQRAGWMGCSDRWFRKRYGQRYRAVYDRLDAWCGVAYRHVQRRLESE